MRSPVSHRILAAMTAAAVLSLTLGAADSSAQVKRPQVPAGSTVLTSHLPDLIPSTLGFFSPNGYVKWGNTEVVDNPSHAKATQVGPQKNLCHFPLVAYRTHNKGDGDAGAFVTKTFANATLAHTHNVPGGLAAKQGIDWHKFSINLKEGMNVIRVVFDANKQVAETDENNTFSVRLDVKIDCNDDGKIGGVTNPVGALKHAPRKPMPDPAPTRTLRLKPAN